MSRRHVCANQRNVTYPIRTKRTFCKPTYKKYMVRCGTQWCEGVRLVYEKYHKEVVADTNQTYIDYTCCPGWTQVTWRSHGCNKPVCNRPCQNGGKCVKPNVCSCAPGYVGSFCETKTSVYAPLDCNCVSQAWMPSPPSVCPCCLRASYQCPSCCPQSLCVPPSCSTGCPPPPCCSLACPPIAPPACPHVCVTTCPPTCPPPAVPYCPTCPCCCSCTRRNGLQDDCPPPCSCLNGGVCNPKSVCECTPGYTGRRCEKDVDECRTKKPCDQICYNTPGSYKCHCKENFVLQKDGQTCRKENDEGTTLEARDLQQENYDKMDKRLLKLEKMMHEKKQNEVTKKDLENIYNNIDRISGNISDLSKKLERLEPVQAEESTPRPEASTLSLKLKNNQVEQRSKSNLKNIEIQKSVILNIEE